MDCLSVETFLATAEMLFGHLRLKDSDRWSSHICQLKYRSFVSEYPEVGDAQFLWAAEQWVQRLDNGFHRYPTWRELMAFLYRCEAGIPNRSWGPKPDLPSYVRFNPSQLAMMPDRASSVAALPPGAESPAAYEEAPRGTQQPSPPTRPRELVGLSDEEWDAYLKSAWAQEVAP
jgi:hypothetical protein